MCFRFWFTVLFCLLCFGVVESFSQCKLIDENQGSVYLTFEKTAIVSLDGKEKKVRGAILQIHNNSDCSIMLTTGDASSFFKPLPPNPSVMQRIKREIEWVLPNGVTVPYLQYWWQTRTSAGTSVGGDMLFGLELQGGHFVRFEVPFSHLDPSFANKIDVEFDYAWEADNGSRIKRSGVINTVRFWVGSLPESVRKEIAASLR